MVNRLNRIWILVSSIQFFCNMRIFQNISLHFKWNSTILAPLQCVDFLPTTFQLLLVAIRIYHAIRILTYKWVCATSFNSKQIENKFPVLFVAVVVVPIFYFFLSRKAHLNEIEISTLCSDSQCVWGIPFQRGWHTLQICIWVNTHVCISIWKRAHGNDSELICSRSSSFDK